MDETLTKKHTFQGLESVVEADQEFIELAKAIVTDINSKYGGFYQGGVWPDMEVKAKFNGQDGVGIYVYQMTAEGLTVKQEVPMRSMPSQKTYPVVLRLSKDYARGDHMLPEQVGTQFTMTLQYNPKDKVAKTLGDALLPQRG